MDKPPNPEEVDFLVCARLLDELFEPDNLIGECCVCGVEVQYPNNAPRKPQKICMTCTIKQMEQGL